MRSYSDTSAPVYHTIAERIEAACRALNMKQRDLAERAGLPSRQRLTQIKSGERPGRKHLEGIAGVIGCTVEWLTTGTGQAPSWATAPPRLTLREQEAPYSAAPAGFEEAPSWALRLLDEVRHLRAEVAELRRRPMRPEDAAADQPEDRAADEIARIMDPDEHPRPEAPTYPRPAAIPGDAPGGR